VVGVLPASLTFPDAATFHMPRQSDVWIAEAWEELRGDSRGNQILRVVGAARPGATPASIAQDLDRVAARFRSEYPARYSEASGWRPVAVPFRDELVGSTRPALTLLMGAAALVLVIACANVANLLLGRGAARRKEFGVKAALGASPFRLARDFTWEAALLGGLAGAMAVSLSAIALPALAAAAPESVPLVAGARLDVVTIAFAAGLSIVVVLLVGLAPALRVSAGDLQPALRDSAAGEGWFWRSVRTGLIVGEIGLAFLVLSLAGVLFRSGVRMAQADLGFRPAGVVTMKVSLPAERYPEAPHRAAFFGDLLGRLASHPQVQGAALADPIPLGGEQWSATLRVEGRDPAPGAALPHAEFYRVSHGYFRAIQGRILEGRDFSAADDRRAPYVVIVDEAFARQHFPGRSAVGQRVNPRGPDAPWSTIVGVVARVRRDGPRHAGEGQLYLPYAQSPTPRMDLIVRSSADTAGVAAIVRGAVRQIDSTMPVTKLSRLEDLAAGVTAGDRFTRLLTTAFAGCALLLAAVGLYGVVAYLVTARTREIGIRLALGSTPAAIRRGVLREGSGWAALGIAGGTCAAFAVSGAVSALVFEVSPLDARTLAAAAVATLAISLAASYIPARRAAAMDPLQALRE
jgi:putative ABC transport system permease protein